MVARTLVVLITLGLVSCSCFGVLSEKPSLVASIRPLALIASDLGGEWLEVEQLVNNNQEPHHIALSVSQRKMLAEADLFIWVGPGLESFLVKPATQLEKQKVLSFQETLEESTVTVKRYSHDYHYWLNPEMVEIFYRVLGQKLADMYPEKRLLVQSRMEQKIADLERTAQRLADRIGRVASGSVIVDHQAYGYFADYFHIRIAGAMVDESGVAAGARTLASLAELPDIACIVVEQMPPSGRALKMAETLNARLVAIDPLGIGVEDDLGVLGLIENVADGFLECYGAPD